MTDTLSLDVQYWVVTVLIFCAICVVILFPHAPRLHRVLEFALAAVWWRYLTDSGLNETDACFIGTNLFLYLFVVLRALPEFVSAVNSYTCHSIADMCLKVLLSMRTACFFLNDTSYSDNGDILLLITLFCTGYVTHCQSEKQIEMFVATMKTERAEAAAKKKQETEKKTE